MNPVNWVINEAYLQRVDYIVNQCITRGMACFIAPAYTGYGRGGDGWLNDYAGVTDAVLQAYGASLAIRYAQGNVVLVFGGDEANDVGAYGNYGSGTSPNRTKQWQIALGIRSVNANVLITGHTARNGTGPVSGEAYKAWTSGYTGFNLNNVYGHDDIDDAAGLAAAAYGRSGYPFFLVEAGYENTDGNDVCGIVPAIQTVLSGGLAGWFGGHDALWRMGSYTPATGATAVLSTYLSASWKAHQALGALLRAYAWSKLRPRTDSTLVTTSKGSAATICPALADDGSFALVWTPGGSLTVNMAALALTNVRARWWNWDSGYSAIGTFPNSGTRLFTPPAVIASLCLTPRSWHNEQRLHDCLSRLPLRLSMPWMTIAAGSSPERLSYGGVQRSTSRVCPALASDGSFAMVLTTGSSVSVNLAALSPTQLRARWFNPLDGSFSAASSGLLANAGMVAFTPPGERVLVLDAG